MADNRFKDFPTDARFPTLGRDVRFENFPTDGRFFEGADTRFEGDTYGTSAPPQPAWVLSAGDGAVTIIEMPAVAAPVAVSGDGQITIEEYA